MLLMKVYDPDPNAKLFDYIAREINILKRNILAGRPSDKLIIDHLDRITKKIQQRVKK